MTGEDAYLRLHPAQPPLHSPVPTHPDSLVFVDIDAIAGSESAWVAKQLRAAPPGFFLAPNSVLIRWPTLSSDDIDLVEQADGIAGLVATRAGRRVPVGLALFPIGEAPRLVWSTGDEALAERAGELLARARAAELEALLVMGRAVWRPSAYHYQLPSGEHSSVFVRVADAIARPRDAVALATWLHALVGDELGIVIDTPTLVPLVLALHATLRSHGLVPGPVATLTDYPANQFEVDQAVADLQGSERLLGLLSVMSTGSVGGRMASALGRQQQTWHLEVLVNRNGRGATEMVVADAERPARPPAWVGFSHAASSYRSAVECRLCRSSESARLVYIDPRSFEAMVLPEPELLMPDVAHAVEARELWSRYDAVGGVGVQCHPHPETRDLRAHRELLAVRCYPHLLFADPPLSEDGRGQEQRGTFLGQVTQRASRIAKKHLDAEGGAAWEPARCSPVVVTQSDWESSGFSAFLDALAAGFGRDPWTADEIVVVSKPYTDIPPEPFTGSTSDGVLVVTVGTVTGSTMQQLLVGLHDVTDAPIGGLVIHARPERSRDWVVLRNSYNRRLDALWLTYLPWRSPLDEEGAVLGRAQEPLGRLDALPDLADAANRFLALRVEITAPAAKDWLERTGRVESTNADPYAVFWGMEVTPPEPPTTGEPSWSSMQRPVLRPGSRFGHRLRAVTTYAAVGAAMQSARVNARQVGAPVWQQFELPAILRSYFDPLILAALLRWLEPHEAWWGARPEDAANVIAEAYVRATESDRKILLPELLLAAAQGKVPLVAHTWLRSEARQCRESWSATTTGQDDAEGHWEAAEVAPVIVGELLLDGPAV